MEFTQSERVLILGGSRGLGAALVQQLRQNSVEALSISRKSEIKADFSKSETWDDIFLKLRSYAPTRIVYCAAGGPYGKFSDFALKDHQWSWRVTFEFPAALLHSFLQAPASSLKQMILIGSSVAEQNPDPGAAAYCASKHALKGLVKTVQNEAELPFDLRLLSPGYMETDLLPPHSAPRNLGKARDPQQIAFKMIQSISDPALRMSHQTID